MPSSSHEALSQRFQQLVEQREAHARALAEIDATLGQIGQIIGVTATRRPGRPPGSGSKSTMVSSMTPSAAPSEKGKRKGRRKRQRFAISGDESVLNFLRGNRNATTQDVKKHWGSEGRGGTADNTLSKLVRDGRLKRIALEGMRGSKFALL